MATLAILRSQRSVLIHDFQLVAITVLTDHTLTNTSCLATFLELCFHLTIPKR